MSGGDVGNILLKVQEDLSKLREQIDRDNDGGQIDANVLRDALQKTENGLKMRAEEVLHLMNNKVVSLPSVEEQLAQEQPGIDSQPSRSMYNLRTNTRGILQTRRTGPSGLLESRGMDGTRSGGVSYAPRLLGSTSQLPALSPGEQVQRENNQRMILNPGNSQNRRLVSEQFGIQLPLISTKSGDVFQDLHGWKETARTDLIYEGTGEGQKDRVVKGSNVDRLAILPRANRVDPQNATWADESPKLLVLPQVENLLPPPAITEQDAQKGILSLVERGLIPPAAEITLDPSPVKHRTAPLHDPSEKVYDRMPADASEPGFNLAGFKLDPNIKASDIARQTIPETLARVLAARQMRRNSREEMARGGSPGQIRTGVGVMKQFEMQLDPNEATNIDSRAASSIAINQEKKLHIVPPTKDDEVENAEDSFNNEMPIKSVKWESPPPTTPASQLSKTGSTHRFAVQNGKSRYQSNDFIAFKQHYCLSWGSIVTVLKYMERLMLKYSVPIAFVNGDKLADLSVEYELEIVPTEAELLSCIINRDDVEDLIRKPGRQFVGPKGMERAATKIQATWKGFKERKSYLEYRRKKWAAGVIAIQWILHMKMSSAKKELGLTRTRQLERFRTRAKKMFANWDKLITQRRVIIHIPSLGFSMRIREGLEDFPMMQNTQMARLCDLKDPNVDVIYISPVPINDELLQYYSKLMGLKSAIDTGEVENQKPITDRYKIIVPEAIKSFPTHCMCLSTHLKYSPRALRRIKNMIRGRQAYIVPGLPHTDDLAVADYLDVPLLSPEPEIAHLYSTKSGAKRIFAASHVAIPPGEYDVYSLEQLHECLAQLITENLSVKRWLFKVDSEFSGRGIAYIDIDRHLKCYGWALKERERYGEKWNRKWAQENAYLRILSEVPAMLTQHTQMSQPEVYPDWHSYLEAYLAQGGIVEAFPPSDSVTNISVDLLLEPNGKLRLLSSGDQLHDDNPLRCWGLSMPQSSIDAGILNQACDRIGEACQQRHIIGHFSVDFVTFIDPLTENQQLWATDLTVRYSDTCALSQLVCFSTNGRFQPIDHVIEIPPKPQPERKNRRWRYHQVEEKADNQRFAIISSNLMHTNLAVVHYSVFFQMCRAHGIGYDVKERQGTMFTLIDSFNRQNLCMVTVSDSLENALQTFGRNLYVIHQEISAPNMQGITNFKPVIKDIEDILGLAIENAVSKADDAI